MNKRPLWNLAAILAAVSLVPACGGGKKTDPYPLATLRTVTRGKPPPSAGFRYKLANPRIEALYRNLGLVRDGNIVEFISGRNLEERLGEGSSGTFVLAVAKEFSPFVHFRVERIYTPSDTTYLTPGAVVLPRVVDAAAFDTGAYERIDIDGVYDSRTDALRNLENRKTRFSCPITEEQGSGGRYFVLRGKNAKFRVAAVTDGIGVVLRLLAEQGYPFEGGVVVTAIEDPQTRLTSGIAGTVEVVYVRYGRRVVSG